MTGTGSSSSTPTADGHVYAAYSQGIRYAFTTAGAPTWSSPLPYADGFGATPSLYQGRLYMRADQLVVDGAAEPADRVSRMGRR